MAKKVIIIGSGFAGLSAACFMAKAGWAVTVLEKHHMPGGRARQLQAEGFRFDMGPSWYWMPDVFERFFRSFGKTVSDYYKLLRLNPSYRIYWDDDKTDIPDDFEDLKILFESFEPGSSVRLEKFLQEATYKYEIGIQNFIYKPGLSVSEFFDARLLKGVYRLDIFNSLRSHVAKYFKHPHLQQLLEFPALFIGAHPQHTPALYSLMNCAAIRGGTWYPVGGMYSVVSAMYQLAVELGVEFRFDHNVTQINIEKNKAKTISAIKTENNITEIDMFEADAVIGGADYHFTETSLLLPQYRSYSNIYWDKRVMAPGCLIYFVGLNRKLEDLAHHSLFFDTPFEAHAAEIYETKQWPTAPLFYVSAPSVTDESVAPEGCENLFFLIPVAAGLKDDSDELREKYFEMVLTRFEKRTGESVRQNIIYKKTFGYTDFVNEYNAFKGNAYGLANTLNQTGILKPSCRSKKVKNLFFTGHLTVPGPGVPPALISGEVVAKEVVKDYK